MVTISGKTIKGSIHSFLSPISFVYEADRYIPCDSLEFTAPFQLKGAEFCEITVYLNGSLLFEGIVDEQKLSSSKSGRTITLCCRNKTALLLDNEVRPNIYFQLTSQQIFEEYAKPFGVLKAEFPYAAKKNFIQIKKGASRWKVIEEFCLQVYKVPPYVNRNRVLVTNPLTSRSFTISNTQNGALRFSKLDVKQNNHKVISRIYMKTGTDTYTYFYAYVLDNPNATAHKIAQERYFHPVSKVTALAMEEVQRIVRDSNREQLVVTVSLPFLQDISIGDSIFIVDECFSNNNLFVSSITLKASEKDGVVTQLTLMDKSYV